ADPLSRRRVGYLPESHRLPPYLTGWQVLELYGMLCGRERAWLRARIPVWLDKVGMLQDAGRKVREYSKGMQQRIGLAQALVHEPELVFLDEPTDGVDPVGRAAIRDVIAELQRGGTTVFINSHLLLEVERMCDRIVILDKGRLVREGTLAELTPHTGAVRFELDALPPDLEARLAGVGKVLERGERHFVLAASDGEVGEAIDRLRRDRLVIRSIEQRRLSLEDTFIDMMTKGRG
ncbi:MAG TPA: ABC transporter ATP-binding protein, partial [Planctomycetota bacterium]|nr:ABC transporter ATP-binding protein [Planctomycetota bacterium]